MAQRPHAQPASPAHRPGGLRVLVVDDHAQFRAAARAVLAADGFDVVGEAVDGAGAVRETRATNPDVVLLDVMLPDADGFEVCARLAAVANPPAVVLTSSRDAIEYRDRLSASTACGFLPKSRLSGAAVAELVG